MVIDPDKDYVSRDNRKFQGIIIKVALSIFLMVNIRDSCSIIEKLILTS